VDHDQAVSDMRQELESSIVKLREIAAEGDENMGKMVDRQLKKLGDVENLASSLEGIVFRHNGKVYKMTGAFAMANQIIGRARRSGGSSQNENKIRIKEKDLRHLIESLMIRSF
jgi:hypothetical protein